MKKTAFVLLTAALLAACNNKRGIPDVSKIKVDIPVERFEQTFFSIDSNHIAEGLKTLREKHPDFYDIFMNGVLGVNGSDTSRATLEVSRQFLVSYLPIYDSLQRIYKDAGWIKKELEKGFRFVRYYFPAYQTGKAITFIGPFDVWDIAPIPAGLAIGLHHYAGRNFSVYQSETGQELFPVYLSRRFEKEYIPANAMKGVVQDLFPDKSEGKPLIEQMIEKGKQWWLLDKFLPETPDSLKTGYTQQQLEWCAANEGLIWSYLVKNEDLYSINPATIQTYIGEGPFTQGFSQELSPGNLGQWIGWQIVKKYAAKNPGMKPEEIMRADPKEILEKAKYKPK